MKRLTGPKWSNGHYHIYANVYPKRKDMEPAFQKIVDRLGRYEDTGLEPDEIPRWIPVSERLPKENEYRDKATGELIPLLVCARSTEYPFRALYDGKNWGDGFNRIDVTHWMPLPAVPKEEK